MEYRPGFKPPPPSRHSDISARFRGLVNLHELARSSTPETIKLLQDVLEGKSSPPSSLPIVPRGYNIDTLCGDFGSLINEHIDNSQLLMPLVETACLLAKDETVREQFDDLIRDNRSKRRRRFTHRDSDPSPGIYVAPSSAPVKPRSILTGSPEFSSLHLSSTPELTSSTLSALSPASTNFAPSDIGVQPLERPERSKTITDGGDCDTLPIRRFALLTESMLNVLERHLNDRSLVLHAVSFLYSVLVHHNKERELNDVFHEFNATTLLVEAMTLHSTVTNVIQEVCCVLRKLLKSSGRSVSDFLRATTNLELFLPTLSLNSRHSQIMSHGINIISLITKAKHHRYRESICRPDVLDLLLEVLTIYSSKDEKDSLTIPPPETIPSPPHAFSPSPSPSPVNQEYLRSPRTSQHPSREHSLSLSAFLEGSDEEDPETPTSQTKRKQNDTKLDINAEENLREKSDDLSPEEKLKHTKHAEKIVWGIVSDVQSLLCQFAACPISVDVLIDHNALNIVYGMLKQSYQRPSVAVSAIRTLAAITDHLHINTRTGCKQGSSQRFTLPATHAHDALALTDVHMMRELYMTVILVSHQYPNSKHIQRACLECLASIINRWRHAHENLCNGEEKDIDDMDREDDTWFVEKFRLQTIPIVVSILEHHRSDFASVAAAIRVLYELSRGECCCNCIAETVVQIIHHSAVSWTVRALEVYFSSQNSSARRSEDNLNHSFKDDSEANVFFDMTVQFFQFCIDTAACVSTIDPICSYIRGLVYNGMPEALFYIIDHVFMEEALMVSTIACLTSVLVLCTYPGEYDAIHNGDTNDAKSNRLKLNVLDAKSRSERRLQRFQYSAILCFTVIDDVAELLCGTDLSSRSAIKASTAHLAASHGNANVLTPTLRRMSANQAGKSGSRRGKNSINVALATNSMKHQSTPGTSKSPSDRTGEEKKADLQSLKLCLSVLTLLVTFVRGLSASFANSSIHKDTAALTPTDAFTRALSLSLSPKSSIASTPWLSSEAIIVVTEITQTTMELYNALCINDGTYGPKPPSSPSPYAKNSANSQLSPEANKSTDSVPESPVSSNDDVSDEKAPNDSGLETKEADSKLAEVAGMHHNAIQSAMTELHTAISELKIMVVGGGHVPKATGSRLRRSLAHFQTRIKLKNLDPKKYVTDKYSFHNQRAKKHSRSESYGTWINVLADLGIASPHGPRKSHSRKHATFSFSSPPLGNPSINSAESLSPIQDNAEPADTKRKEKEKKKGKSSKKGKKGDDEGEGYIASYQLPFNSPTSSSSTSTTSSRATTPSSSSSTSATVAGTPAPVRYKTNVHPLMKTPSSRSLLSTGGQGLHLRSDMFASPKAAQVKSSLSPSTDKKHDRIQTLTRRYTHRRHDSAGANWLVSPMTPLPVAPTSPLSSLAMADGIFTTDYAQETVPDDLTEEQVLERWESLMKVADASFEAPLAIRNHQDTEALVVKYSIPNSVRGKVWMLLSGATEEKARWGPNYYQEMVVSSNRPEALESAERDEIRKDVPRTLPEIPMFQTQEGRDKLERVLAAYCVRNAESVGYCQSMNLLCGVLLTCMEEEEAFWVFCVLIESRCGYYSHSMCGLQVDRLVFADLLSFYQPDLEDHLRATGLGTSLDFSVPWFLCLFMEAPFNFSDGLRIWDNLFLLGDELLFAVALSILSVHKRELMQLDSNGELIMYLLNNNEMRSRLDVDQIVRDLTLTHNFASQIEQLREFRKVQVQAEFSKLESAKANRFCQDFGFEREAEVQQWWSRFLSPSPWNVLLTSVLPTSDLFFRAFCLHVWPNWHRARWRDHGLFSGVIQRLFAVVDTNHSHKVSFHEFLEGAYTLTLGSQLERAEFCFRFCDIDGDDLVSHEDLLRACTMLHIMYHGRYSSLKLAEQEAGLMCYLLFERSKSIWGIARLDSRRRLEEAKADGKRMQEARIRNNSGSRSSVDDARYKIHLNQRTLQRSRTGSQTSSHRPSPSSPVSLTVPSQSSRRSSSADSKMGSDMHLLSVSSQRSATSRSRSPSASHSQASGKQRDKLASRRHTLQLGSHSHHKPHNVKHLNLSQTSSFSETNQRSNNNSPTKPLDIDSSPSGMKGVQNAFANTTDHSTSTEIGVSGSSVGGAEPSNIELSITNDKSVKDIEHENKGHPMRDPNTLSLEEFCEVIAFHPLMQLFFGLDHPISGQAPDECELWLTLERLHQHEQGMYPNSAEVLE